MSLQEPCVKEASLVSRCIMDFIIVSSILHVLIAVIVASTTCSPALLAILLPGHASWTSNMTYPIILYTAEGSVDTVQKYRMSDRKRWEGTALDGCPAR